jgi:hypothetical protein
MLPWCSHQVTIRFVSAGWLPGAALQGVGALACARRPALLRLADARGAELHRLVNSPAAFHCIVQTPAPLRAVSCMPCENRILHGV